MYSGSSLLFAALDLLLKVTVIVTADAYTSIILTAPRTAKSDYDDSSPDQLMSMMLAAVKPHGGRMNQTISGTDHDMDHKPGTLAPGKKSSGDDSDRSLLPKVVLNEQWRADLLQRIVDHIPKAYR